ncbi:MAG: hypothetical protein IT460_17550 [Planctomycetes bacterium]|nr:hypothetical protein [Planctomycetota bacterium]
MAFWLKRWGTGDDPYRDDMLVDHLSFSDRSAPRGIPKVHKGDLLIVTGVKTHGALVAAARATSEVWDTGTNSQWHWHCAADFYFKVPMASAPALDSIPDSDGVLPGWLRTGDGLRELTDEQYRAAEAAIKRAMAST